MHCSYRRSLLILALVFNAGVALATDCHAPKIVSSHEDQLESGRDWAAIPAVISKYREFAQALCEGVQRHRESQVRACCQMKIAEPTANQICGLMTFLAGDERDSTTFLNIVPSDRDGSLVVFDLDRFDINPDTAEIDPICGDPEGLTGLYIDALYRLVRRNDARAIEKYVQLSNFAEGEYGEYMEGQFEQLFKQRPEVAFENWPTIRKSLIVDSMVEEIGRDDCLSILNGVGKVCAAHRTLANCSDIRAVCTESDRIDHSPVTGSAAR